MCIRDRNWYLSERAKVETLRIIRISVYSDNLAIFWKSVQEAFSRAGFDILRDYPCPTDEMCIRDRYRAELPERADRSGF